MGKVTSPTNFSTVSTWEDLRRFVSQFCADVLNQINGRISYTDNIQCVFLPVTFTLANTDVPVQHSLGYVPNGFMVVEMDRAGIVYNGSSKNSSVIFLKASVAGMVTKIQVF